MSDLIERLRTGCDGRTAELDYEAADALEAKDREIERLTAELELRRNCKLAVVIAKERMAEQDEKIAKLQAALESVYGSAKPGHVVACRETAKLALAALKDTTTNELPVSTDIGSLDEKGQTENGG